MVFDMSGFSFRPRERKACSIATLTCVADLGEIGTPLLCATLDNTQRPRRPCRELYLCHGHGCRI
jgi:hypothetical protein